MVQTAAGLAPSMGKAREKLFFPLPALGLRPWLEYTALLQANGAPPQALEVVTGRTYSLLQPDLHSLEDSGILGSLDKNVMGEWAEWLRLMGGVGQGCIERSSCRLSKRVGPPDRTRPPPSLLSAPGALPISSVENMCGYLGTRAIVGEN